MRNRNNMIKVMLNDEELEHLNKQLENRSLNKSVLIRKLISGVKVNPAPVDEYRKISVLLSNVTNDLNQIARQANTTDPTGNEKLDVVIILVRKCWQLLRELR